jgi:hypothetical protein
MSLSRAEKLEKLKALREAKKNTNNKTIEETLNDLDTYLSKYNLEEQTIEIEIKSSKKESKIKNLISKFNQLLI